GENALAHLVLQERNAARDRRARDRREERRGDAAGEAVLENHRSLLARYLFRADALGGAFAGDAADLLGRGQVGEEAFGAPLIVALHFVVLLGDGLGAERVRRAAFEAFEAV